MVDKWSLTNESLLYAMQDHSEGSLWKDAVLVQDVQHVGFCQKRDKKVWIGPERIDVVKRKREKCVCCRICPNTNTHDASKLTFLLMHSLATRHKWEYREKGRQSRTNQYKRTLLKRSSYQMSHSCMFGEVCIRYKLKSGRAICDWQEAQFQKIWIINTLVPECK